MADRDEFTAQEWTLLRVTPSFVSVGVSAADASGLYSAVKEAIAGSHEVILTLTANSHLELFSALAADRSLPDLPDVDRLVGDGSNQQRLDNFKSAALEHVSAAVALVVNKASGAEAEAYRKLLIRVAERAANASKEGGFLGFGGVRVSDKERTFISLVSAAAGVE